MEAGILTLLSSLKTKEAPSSPVNSLSLWFPDCRFLLNDLGDSGSALQSHWSVGPCSCPQISTFLFPLGSCSLRVLVMSGELLSTCCKLTQSLFSPNEHSAHLSSLPVFLHRFLGRYRALVLASGSPADLWPRDLSAQRLNSLHDQVSGGQECPNLARLWEMYKRPCTSKWALVHIARMMLSQWALFGWFLFQTFYTDLTESNSHLPSSQYRERKVTLYSDINHALWGLQKV